MSILRISRTLDSDTLHLPELKPLLGKKVEITVQEESESGCFNGSPDPCLLDAETTKALQTLLTPEQLDALVDIVSQGGPDVDMIRKIRAASMQ